MCVSVVVYGSMSHAWGTAGSWIWFKKHVLDRHQWVGEPGEILSTYIYTTKVRVYIKEGKNE